MAKIGLSLMPTEDFARASLPLFEDGAVDTLEWSFDMGWRFAGGQPEWARELLDFFASEDSLTGHGVFFSPCSMRWLPEHDRWLEQLHKEVQQRKYKRISEHFGFARTSSFVNLL